MLTINATDARELQRVGINPEQHLHAAMDRIQAAIIDTARKCKPQVVVLVYDITMDQVPVIVEDLERQDFKVKVDPDYEHKPNKVFTVSWA